MRRWHRERHISLRQQRLHWRLAHDWAERPVDCECEWQLGRFRKLDGGDCGNARCYICHIDKVLDRPRRGDRLAELRLREGIDEL
jgi:hypothetical protein